MGQRRYALRTRESRRGQSESVKYRVRGVEHCLKSDGTGSMAEEGDNVWMVRTKR